ncbi:TIGR02677 family protein [Iamia sp.]|uniref:TIGR02677 family protein n=1 Tax=Iamia sp. TaxID=2722710 RepID=UPI002B8BA9AF|nr:TIGR02677 family protein [Iamia sp.]HXH56232.1 TIGR02677 family protein [Iamia sp.]
MDGDATQVGAGRPGSPRELFGRLQQGEQRDRLLVLRAATEANAPVYVAVLAAFVAARERYEVEVRTDRIAADLDAAGLEVDNLDAALDQLRQWGNLTWTQDTARVARLEDFRQRRALWQLTAAGQAAHDAIVAVLDASDQSGSLQRTLFRDIRENLQELAGALDRRDPERAYLRLRDLDGSLRDLAANARDFHAAVAQLRREHDVAPDRFLAYKDLLITYLEQFLEHLVAQRALVVRAVQAVEERGIDRLVELAAAGDDSAGLFDDGDRAELWRERWDGLAGWFVAPPRGAAGADDLIGATTAAISDLLSLLRQVTESARRPITRASELVVLARWFRRLGTDAEAAELFDAAFGLGRPLHLGGADDDPETTPAATSWWDATPVPVPVTLREHGRRPSSGRSGHAADFSAHKARLAAEHRAAQAARAEAAARLRARPVEGRVLSDPELAVLFELLDRAAHQRPVGDAPGHDAPVVIEGTAARLEPDPDGMAVRSRRGTLTLSDHRLVVGAVAAGAGPR